MKKPVFLCAILLLIIVYFAYHAFTGESGLARWAGMQQELHHKSLELEELEAENAHLEDMIARLSPETLDEDLVETIAREKLKYVFPDELMIMEPSLVVEP